MWVAQGKEPDCVHFGKYPTTGPPPQTRTLPIYIYIFFLTQRLIKLLKIGSDSRPSHLSFLSSKDCRCSAHFLREWFLFFASANNVVNKILTLISKSQINSTPNVCLQVKVCNPGITLSWKTFFTLQSLMERSRRIEMKGDRKQVSSPKVSAGVCSRWRGSPCHDCPRPRGCSGEQGAIFMVLVLCY